MPSKGTQTRWSWLKGTAEEHLESSTVSSAGSTCTADESRVTERREEENEKDDEPAHTGESGSEDHLQTENSGGTVEANTQSPGHELSEDHHHGEEIANSAVSPPQQVTEDCHDGGEANSLPQELIRQLEELVFPSDSEGSSEEEEEGPGSDDQPEPALPDLASTQLPRPAILRYLRESESLASDYFSLGNTEEVAGRIPMVGRTLAGEGGQNSSSGREETQRRAEGIGPLLAQGGSPCEFCGQTRPVHNLWSHSDEQGSPFCCAEYQEFCLLAAAYMRQMVQRRQNQRPRKISISPSKKRAFRKTMEERALAMMRRKKKWEELRRRRIHQLQSSSFYSLTKQTKTIQFSLLSPTVAQAVWLTRPESSTHSQGSTNHLILGRRRRRRGRRRELEGGKEKSLVQSRREELEVLGKEGILPPELVERLQQCALPLGSLDVRVYGSGQPFLTLLPDRTGQCHYPSGRLAVVCSAPYPGVLGYLVFEDRQDCRLLATLDELGHACCYYPDGSMRLLLTVSHGTLYDDRGVVKATWSWRKHARSSIFQPLSLILNKHIQLRCSAQDNLTLTFSAPPHFVKFNIGCKISKDLPEVLKSPKDKKVHRLQSHLKESQANISHLLQALQYTKKLSQLQSVYSKPPNKTGHHGSSRKRTRSTGALVVQGHQRTTRLRPLV